MTTPTPTPHVSGRAVYIEADHESHKAVMQVLIMPEGMTSAHVTVPMTMYRRRLTAMQPRKTWRQIASSNSSASVKLKTTDKAVVAAEMLGFTKTLFDSFSSNGWAIRKEPVFVEVTAEDLEHARQAKTPYKVFGRVWKARKALGFPKDFLILDAASPA